MSIEVQAPFGAQVKDKFIELLRDMPILLAIPSFVKTTLDWSLEDKFAYAGLGMLATFIVLMCFYFFGSGIEFLFGINSTFLSFAGGLILLISGYKMTTITLEDYNKKEIPKDKQSKTLFGGLTTGAKFLKMLIMAIFPLAWPMISGPGAATAVMKLSDEGVLGEGAGERLGVVSLAILGNLGIQFACLALGIGLAAWADYGNDYAGIVLMSKMLGFFLCAIGSSMILNSAKETLSTKGDFTLRPGILAGKTE